MVRYFKYIVIIFGGIGLIAVSFFVLQNKQDITQAYKYKDKLDYNYLSKKCQDQGESNLFPCLKEEFKDYLAAVSLTGTSIGLKMVFNLMDEDRANYQGPLQGKVLEFTYSLYHLEINNLAMDKAYRNYFGFSFLYGGFISSLKQYYLKAYLFSQNIINGIEGPQGIVLVKNSVEYKDLEADFSRIKNDFYRIKSEANEYVDIIWTRLQDESQNTIRRD